VGDLARLPTPSLLLDRERLVRNAARMRAIADRTGVVFRPHVKTHKSPEIARLQHGGVPGPITVSTLAEAEAFEREGFSDVTYAVPIEPGKFARAFELSRRVRLHLLTDDEATTEALHRAASEAGVRISIFLEVDCGDHRCGVDPGASQAIALARQIADSPSLIFAGLLTHAGHSYAATTLEAVRRVARQERDATIEFADRLRAAGVAVPVISIGSTPTMTQADDLSGVTEIRPGNYIFFDSFQAVHGSCTFEDCALTVLAAVVHNDGKRVVVDAGAIALSKDLGPRDLDPDSGYGHVLDLEARDTGLRIGNLSQEHGEIDLPPGADAGAFPAGSRVRVLVNHACLTAAQHERYHVIEQGRLVAEWPIARGW
jgi:D-serine deaminase-like pyridoxal phosphate-dependent protein